MWFHAVEADQWRVAVTPSAIAVRRTAERRAKDQIYAILGCCEHRPFFARIVVDRFCEHLRERAVLPAQVRQSKLLELPGIADHDDDDLDRLVGRVHPAMQGREQEVKLLEIVRGIPQLLLVVLAEHDDVRSLRHAPVAHLHVRFAGARDRDGRVTILHRRRQLRVRREAHGNANDEKQRSQHFSNPHLLAKHPDQHQAPDRTQINSFRSNVVGGNGL